MFLSHPKSLEKLKKKKNFHQCSNFPDLGKIQKRVVFSSVALVF